MTAVDTDFLSLDLVHMLNLPLRQEALRLRHLVHLYIRKIQLPGLRNRVIHIVLHALKAGDIRSLDCVALVHGRLDAVTRTLARLLQ